MDWVSFHDLLPIFFVKKSLFSLASAKGNSIRLDMYMINRTHPSCAKVKSQVDFATKIHDCVKFELLNSKTNETRVQKVKIQYNILQKYCHTCKLQVHVEVECRSLHPELKKLEIDEKQEGDKKEEQSNVPVQRRFINGKVVFAKLNPTNTSSRLIMEPPIQ